MKSFADRVNEALVAEEVDSKFSGRLRVTKDPVWGTYISAQTPRGWLTQSGGVVKSVWRTALDKVKGEKSKAESCLILGLGGGTIAWLVRKRWPDAKIIGVDVDEVFVELGKKHLKLNEQNVEIVIADAFDFIHGTPYTEHHSLICIDTYCGDDYPEKFENRQFLENVKKALAPGGMAVFNRLYYGKMRAKAENFSKKLEKRFSEVERVYPEANIMFVCSNI